MRPPSVGGMLLLFVLFYALAVAGIFGFAAALRHGDFCILSLKGCP